MYKLIGFVHPLGALLASVVAPLFLRNAEFFVQRADDGGKIVGFDPVDLRGLISDSKEVRQVDVGNEEIVAFYVGFGRMIVGSRPEVREHLTDALNSGKVIPTSRNAVLRYLGRRAPDATPVERKARFPANLIFKAYTSRRLIVKAPPSSTLLKPLGHRSTVFLVAKKSPQKRRSNFERKFEKHAPHFTPLPAKRSLQ